MTTTLVTGGAGFIGSHLVEALLDQGHHVIVYDDLSTGSIQNLSEAQANPNLEIVLDSIAQEESLLAQLERADEIYHLAAVVGVRLVLEQPERTAETNVGPTEIILRYLSRNPKPFFLASTSEVYGKSSKVPLSEEDDLILGPPTISRWIYACSKAMDEYLALAHHQRTGLPVVVGRFFNVVGPRQIGRYGMVVPRFIQHAKTGGPLIVHDDGEQVRCFSHVQDVIGGMMALMSTPAAYGKIFNLGNDQPTSIRGLAEMVIRVVNPQATLEHVSYQQAFGKSFEDIRCRIPDLTRIKQTIDYQPEYDLEAIIRELASLES